ncbi:MAG: MgtC/SapB family protein [Persephonella sp.]|nr:MAG: MgtC/SapB family protein [Persephonella sp.]
MNITFDSLTSEIIFKIFFSLGLGLIIGLEREHRTKLGETFAGIRTIPLITILGTLSAYIYENYWDKVFYFTFGAIVLYTILNFYLEYQKDVGITTEITILIAYTIGIFVYFEQFYTATILTVITAVLLALKNVLESFAKKLSQEDIVAILKFIIITAVIYPILPDKNIGWFNAFNIKDIWKMVIIVSTLDFIGYALLKWKGVKTLWLNGIIGGLVSSTAVSYELAKKTKEYPSLVNSATLGISVAWTIMNFRVIFLAGIISIELAKLIIIPLVLISIGFLLAIWFKQKMKRRLYTKDSSNLNINNPFEIRSALQFGFIYALIVFSVKALDFYLGNEGIYLASLISGVIDVDAITLSISRFFANGRIEMDVAVKGILLAVLSNSFFKFGYIYFFGTKELAKNIFIFLLIITVITLIWLIF